MEQNEVSKKQKSSIETNEVLHKAICTRRKKRFSRSIEFSLGKGPSSLGKG
jgi:hypothetical protein